jgi:hypothetical protein
MQRPLAPEPAGVQVDPVGHALEAPTVQGSRELKVVVLGFVVFTVAVGMQRPPQVMVCVQVELVGHAAPPTMQGTVYKGGGEELVQSLSARTRGKA